MNSLQVTGIAGNTASAKETTATDNQYDTEAGQMASSTGNIYGIYDLSGGVYEHVAAFDIKGELWSHPDAATWAAAGKSSTKWATVYTNGTSNYDGVTIYTVSKTGDMTKEVKKNYSSSSSWFSDNAQVMGSNLPFVCRGNYYRDFGQTGVFSSDGCNGFEFSTGGFRVTLAP